MNLVPAPLLKLGRALRGRRYRDLLDAAIAQRALVRAQVMVWRRPQGAFVSPAAAGASAPVTLDEAARQTCARWNLAVARAAHYGVFRPHCLVNAVALSSLLEAHGISGHRIRVGVRRDATGFRAHAWVEVGAWVVGETPEGIEPYTPLTDLHVLR